MLLMMRAPDPFCRLLIPRHSLMIASRRRRAWLVVRGAAAGGVALLDVLHSISAEGVREEVLGDAVAGACCWVGGVSCRFLFLF